MAIVFVLKREIGLTNIVAYTSKTRSIIRKTVNQISMLLLTVTFVDVELTAK